MKASAATAAEASRASIAFHIALTQIGVGTIEEAMALWNDVNPAKVSETATRWLDRAVLLVMSRRAMSRDLAFAYYRLVRALRTGSTIADPYHPLKANPTLADLREEFAGMVADVGGISDPTSNVPQAQRVIDTQLADKPAKGEPVSSAADDDRLLVEELKHLEEEEARLTALAEEEARLDLEALGPANLESRLKDVKPDLSASEMDAIREEAHRVAGAQQAAAAERIALNGGRSALWSYGEQDDRVLGYVRVSRSGTPCGFCAMLISRGVVFYKSEASAQFKSDGDLYHNNCHCYAEPVFTKEQYANDPKFDLNRKYAVDWPVVTKGYGGKDALNTWRRHINKEQGRTFRKK